ncbi:hypothetical protein BGZ60DRAFT_526446 [Tricladium varicosporioides]|nr:hypothetical protein BGZ60DRAFT_526446 [Hymenoscyphus varicosporioides]
MRLSNLAIVAALVATSSATSNSTTTTNSLTPCGQISAALAKYYSNELNLGTTFRFPASAGYACLQSSTFNNTLGVAFVTELKKYMQFQSTLNYLKNPPKDYWYPATDILGGLDKISSTAAAGGYRSQYDFDKALHSLASTSHEGHLSLALCTQQAMRFQRGFRASLQLVSVSEDGTSLPKIVVVSDIQSSNGSIPTVDYINGKNATAFMEELAMYGQSDPDSAYNNLFYSYGLAAAAGSFVDLFSGLNAYQYPGDFTNITYSNGTTISINNYATISPGVWDYDIVDGETFTDAFCILPAQSSDDSSSSTNTTATSTSATASRTATSVSKTYGTTAPTLIGYPYLPVAKDPNNQVAGYFMNGTKYSDTAILRIPSFANETTVPQSAASLSFVNATRDFFAAARAANKTKLIIDVMGNPGGNTILPNDVFQRLFPSIEPYGGSRVRVPPAAEIYGETLAAVPDNFFVVLASDNTTIQQIKGSAYTSPWNYRGQLTTDLQNFTGWNTGSRPFYSSTANNGDKFTEVGRIPGNNSYYDIVIDGFVPYGYAGQPENPQPFAAENVVLLTDGTCASACSIFAEFLTRQANTKTIVVGGRPRYAAMQAIGGTKGTQVQPFQNLAITTSLKTDDEFNISQYIPDSLINSVNDTLPGLVPLPLGDPAILKSYQLNLKDNIPQGDTAGIPLQFVFEPANCKIFFTPDTIFEPMNLWRQVHDIAWNGGKCSWGGMDTIVSNNGSGVGVPTTGNNSTIQINGALEMTAKLSSVILAAGAVLTLIL